ncbi:MAG: ClbS/DfsB family four-helix bundle protein [Anaerolineaceae bacterium]|nr:ClbS/DfsB family four-helix bundle protein [Anaerolineaceae bacterium]
MAKQFPDNKAALLAEIDRDWQSINRFLDSLSTEQWLHIKNPDGWATLDHVTHLIAWEQSVIYLLRGKPRREALQVDEALYQSGDYDAINHVIMLLHKDEPLAQVKEQFQATHAELMGLINGLSDEQLRQPYVRFLPDAPSDAEGPPLINLIYVNTAEHYRDHKKWISETLGI